MRRLVLGIAVAVTSLMPVVGMADDQQIAEYVKSRLKTEQDNGNLKGFNVDMRVDGGTVWFEGFVSSPQQQMTILRTAQQAGHLGVVQVVDDIEVRGSAPYQAASAAYQGYGRPAPVQSASYRAPLPPVRVAARRARAARRAPAAPYAPTQEFFDGGYNEPLPFASCESCAIGGGAPVFDSGFSSGVPVDSGFIGGEVIDGSFGDVHQGVPVTNYGSGTPLAAGFAGDGGGGGGAGAGASGGPANLPGYAWPSYAAAPNYGAVSYPRQHSASAWPYIGPFYPYPQVPLGWRKVSLEWDDGWWHLDFHDK